MSFDSSVGCTDWSKTEVVSPPNHHTIECLDHCVLGQKGLVPSGLLAYRLAHALYPFLRRCRAQIGNATSSHRVTPPERVPQEVELLFRQITDPRLRLVTCWNG